MISAHASDFRLYSSPVSHQRLGLWFSTPEYELSCEWGFLCRTTSYFLPLASRLKALINLIYCRYFRLFMISSLQSYLVIIIGELLMLVQSIAHNFLISVVDFSAYSAYLTRFIFTSICISLVRLSRTNDYCSETCTA